MKVFQYNRLKAITHFAKAVDYSKHSVKDISLIGLSMFAAPLTYNKIANTAIQTNSAIKLAKFLPGSNHLLDSFSVTVNKFTHSLVDHPVSWLAGITASKFTTVKVADYLRTDSRDSNLVESLFSPFMNPCYTFYHTSMGLYHTAKSYRYVDSSDENYGFDIDINNPFVDRIDSSDEDNNSETLKLERISLQEKENTDDTSSPALIDILRNKYSVTLGILSDDPSFVNVSMNQDVEVDCTGCNESTFNYITEIE